jgi:monoterpene epsilon-lactone hydrolase
MCPNVARGAYHRSVTMTQVGSRRSVPAVAMHLFLRQVSRRVISAIPPTRFGVTMARAGIHILSSPAITIPGTGERVRESGPLGQVRGEWVGRPAPGRVLYYLHGSAFVLASPGTHRGLVMELARRMGCAAFTLDYRLAPEHVFPAAHDDVLNGYLWLIEQGYRPEEIVVAGDSAGGQLGLSLLGQLRDRGMAQPAAMIAMSPVVDTTCETLDVNEPLVPEAFLTLDAAHCFLGMYTADADPADPRLDIAAHVTGDLAPTLIQVGSWEALAGDAVLYRDAAEAAGATCELQVYAKLFHVFQIGFRLMPEASYALNEIVRFVEAYAPRKVLHAVA